MEILYINAVGSFMVEYKLTDQEKEALKEIKEKRYLEYTYKMSSDSFDMEGWYEGRNTNTSHHTLEGLIENRLIKQDIDAWHTMYVLTKLGKKYLEVMEL